MTKSNTLCMICCYYSVFIRFTVASFSCWYHNTAEFIKDHLNTHGLASMYLPFNITFFCKLNI